MKRKALLFTIMLVIALSALLLSGCRPLSEVIFPAESDQIGYYISCNEGHAEVDGKWIVSAKKGSSLEFNIIEEDGYSIKNVEVKANGVALNFIDESDEYRTSYKYIINSVGEKVEIVISGVVKEKYTFKVDYVRYKENAEDTQGVIYNPYSDSLVFRYNKTPLLIDDFISDINDQDITFEYGDTLEFYAGEMYKGQFEANSFSILNGSDGFDGIVAAKNGDSFEHLNNINAEYLLRETDFDSHFISDHFLVTGNLYKYSLTVTGNVCLYLDTFMLRKVEYRFESASCAAYQIDIDRKDQNTIYYDSPWKLSVTKNFSEEYPSMYENMKVYINGKDITANMTGDKVLTLDLSGRTVPSAYNTNSYDTFVVTVGGIDLSANETEETKLLIEPHELIPFWNYSPMPYCIMDGYDYFLTDAESLIVSISIWDIYDYTDFAVTVNDKTLTWSNLISENLELSRDEYSIHIKIQGPVYEDAYNISFAGIEKKKCNYTIKNDLSAEVNMYLIIGDSEQLITKETNLVFEHGDQFRVRITGKLSEDVSGYEITGVVLEGEENNNAGHGYGPTFKEWDIKVNCRIDSEGRTVNIKKN